MSILQGKKESIPIFTKKCTSIWKLYCILCFIISQDFTVIEVKMQQHFKMNEHYDS